MATFKGINLFLTKSFGDKMALKFDFERLLIPLVSFFIIEVL